MGRRVHTWHGPRRGPGDPRGAARGVHLRRRPGYGPRRDRRAGCVSCRARRSAHRGHCRRDRRRLHGAHQRTQGSVGLMAQVSTNDLKNGMALDLPEGLVTVVEFQHVKPGKGGAFVRTKLKNVRTGAVLDRTYRADEKLEQAIIDKREMQYLYRDGEQYVFMDNTTYDQMHVESATLGDAVKFLKEGDAPVLQMYGGQIV